MSSFNPSKKLINNKSVLNLAIFLLIVAAIGLVLYPNFQQLQIENKKVGEKRSELEIEKNYFSSLKNAKEDLRDYQKELLLIGSALPEKPSLPSLLNYLSSSASANGLFLTQVNSFKTSPSTLSEELEETIVNLSYLGQYPSFKNFVKEIEKSSRLINVQKIIFSEEGGSPEYFEFEIELKVYSYPKK